MRKKRKRKSDVDIEKEEHSLRTSNATKTGRKRVSFA